MKLIRNLLIIIAIIVTALFFALNPILKNIITEQGTNSLNTPVMVGEVQSSVKDARFTIKNIGVKNPAGFSNNSILNIGDLVVDINGDSDRDFIIVDEFSLSGVEINVEQNASGVNIKTLADSLNSGTSQSSANSSSDESERKVLIKQFTISNAKVDLKSDLLNETVDIPTIFLTNIGGESGIGITQLAPQIVQILIDAAEEILKTQGLDAVKGKIEESITRQVSKKLGFEADTLDNAKDQLKEKTNEVTDKLKNMFKF